MGTGRPGDLMVEFTRADWRFLIRSLALLILASIVLGTGFGLTVSGFFFGVSASATDASVLSLAALFELIGPGLLIIGVVIFGLVSASSVRRGKRIRAGRTT